MIKTTFTVDYGRTHALSRSSKLLIALLAIPLVAGIGAIWFGASSPSGRSADSGLAMQAYTRMRVVSTGIQQFQQTHGRLPLDLEEFKHSQYGGTIEVKGFDRKLRFGYLGEKGRTIDTLIYCVPGEWGSQGIVYLDFNLNVHQESYEPWLKQFRDTVERLDCVAE